MAKQAIVQGEIPPEGDHQHDAALRPRLLREVIGQKPVIQRLGIVLKACKKLKEPLPHILFDGPPGLGKTTSGPALTKPSDLLPFLSNAAEGTVLFIDEIHRMPRVVEEFIYPAMEDFRVDIILGEGMNARTISLPLRRFTLIGATTRSGMLSGPMRDRFKMHEHLDYYTVEELAQIVTINARKLQTPIAPDAAQEIARRSRGTPRVANSRLWWARHFATSEADGAITLPVAEAALAMAEVDGIGLDKQDRRYLDTLVSVFEGGPTGVEALAATMNLPVDTLSDEVEPYLLREQLVIRTPRGRMATPRAYQHLGKTYRARPESPEQKELFDEPP
jgi:holliday junction DNA helicase RuvB